MRDYLIIFGAAVRPDGSASGSLERRVTGALSASRNPALGLIDPVFVPTGGVGRYGPAEAEVMRDLLLAAGVAEADILVEPLADDTLASVRLVDRLLRPRGDDARLVVCTSRYHQPRCALLFRLAGYRVLCPPMPSDRAALGWPKLLRYVLKEILVLPYDALLLLASSRSADQQ